MPFFGMESGHYKAEIGPAAGHDLIRDLMIPPCNGTSLEKLHRKKCEVFATFQECTTELSQLVMLLAKSLVIGGQQDELEYLLPIALARPRIRQPN